MQTDSLILPQNHEAGLDPKNTAASVGSSPSGFAWMAINRTVVDGEENIRIKQSGCSQLLAGQGGFTLGCWLYSQGALNSLRSFSCLPAIHWPPIHCGNGATPFLALQHSLVTPDTQFCCHPQLRTELVLRLQAVFNKKIEWRISIVIYYCQRGVIDHMDPSASFL